MIKDKLEITKKIKPKKKVSLEDFLLGNIDYIRIRAIERKLGMPETTIYRCQKNKRSIPDKWRKPLIAFFTEELQVGKKKDLEEFMLSKKDYFKIIPIEKELGIPKTTVHKSQVNNFPINDKWKILLMKFLKDNINSALIKK